MTPENLTLCAANCQTGADCRSGCCASLRNGVARVCSAADYCKPPPPAPTLPIGCGDLIIVAEDREYLGIATADKYASDGVCNKYSNYGSEYSSTSIFNEYGNYGSEYSSSGSYNPYTSTPPVLFCSASGEPVAYISKNQTLSPRIDPDLLCIILEQARI